MKILNFGSCNIDTVYRVDHITQPGETNAAESVENFPGGKGLNQSVALAKAGAKVYHAGCIGTDGGMLTQVMTKYGVDLRYLRTVDEKTGHAIIQVSKSGENGIIVYPGANGLVTRAYIDSVLGNFCAGDFLLVQNEISELQYLVEKAAERGMRVVLNPSPYHESLKKMDLGLIYCVILNELEAVSVFGSQDPGEIQCFLNEHQPDLQVVLTLGKNGSAHVTKDRIHRQGAYCVENVDTTAAGDTYTGYFIAGISKGKTAKSAMRYASAASALAISKKGAASSIPLIEDVEKQLETLCPYALNTPDKQKEVVARFLEAHYSDGTLEMLAKKLGYTPSYTSNWLVSNMEATFTGLMQRKKCEVCAKYLLNTSLSVSEIIEKIGYRNESHFRKIFQAEYGCTPLKYRQRMGSKHE